jgi:hypothetical protein
LFGALFPRRICQRTCQISHSWLQLLLLFVSYPFPVLHPLVYTIAGVMEYLRHTYTSQVSSSVFVCIFQKIWIDYNFAIYLA